MFDGAIGLQVQDGLDLGRWQLAGQDEVDTSGDFGEQVALLAWVA